MHVSAGISVTDFFPVSLTPRERVLAMLLKSEKQRMFQTLSILHIPKELKSAGIDGIELMLSYRTTESDIRKIQTILKPFMLPIKSLHQSLHSFRYISLEEIENLCIFANVCKSSVIVLHVEALGERLFNMPFIGELKRLQKKYQVTFGIENVPKSPLSRNMPYAWRAQNFSDLMHRIDLFITCDITHLGQVDADICSFFEQNHTRIVNIHISDYRKHWMNTQFSFETGTHLPLGKGTLPIKEFFALVKKHRYKGLITMEINGNLVDLCESANFIRN